MSFSKKNSSMFFFKRKKAPGLDLSWIGTDMHAHLLPGIDDGAPDPATSIELVSGLVKRGYRKLIATPHILWEVYPNTPEIISEKAGALRAALTEAGVEVELGAAAEYFMDEHFTDLLNRKAPLLTLSGNLVLVEFSMVTAPMDLMQLLFELQLQQYQPVIAHPERYIYLARRKELFEELRTAGCWFQLNLLSLTGYYGRSVQELATWLLKENYYDLAGTDLHNLRQLEALDRLAGSPLLEKLKEEGRLRNSSL